MRKFGFLSVFVLTFLIYSATGFAYYEESQPPSMQILLSMSVGGAKNGDMTDMVKDDAKYFELDLGSSGYNKFSDIKTTKANLPVGFDLDFRYFFDNIGVGFQIGYYLDKAEAKVTASDNTSSLANTTATSTMELWVVPYVGTVFYRLAFSPNSFMLFGGGLGYYKGKITYDLEYTGGIAASDSGTYKQSKIGYHILAEYDYAFDIGFTLFAGLKAKYVQFDKFKGGGETLENWDDSKLEAGLTGISFYFGLGFSF